MKYIGLDLSTKTGWAVIDSENLIDYGLIQIKISSIPLEYPFNFCVLSNKMAENILKVVKKHWSIDSKIIIEDTNIYSKSKRYSQKVLEFIHCATIDCLMKNSFKPIMINTSKWRSIIGISMGD